MRQTWNTLSIRIMDHINDAATDDDVNYIYFVVAITKETIIAKNGSNVFAVFFGTIKIIK